MLISRRSNLLTNSKSRHRKLVHDIDRRPPIVFKVLYAQTGTLRRIISADLQLDLNDPRKQ